jgi:hypothetical protein
MEVELEIERYLLDTSKAYQIIESAIIQTYPPARSDMAIGATLPTEVGDTD